MAPRDNFEIYYFQDGRWSVHASYEASQREVAMGEAQELEKTLRAPVRLVRETYYPETNTSEEAVSWQSAMAKQMPDADTMFGAKPAAAKKKPPPRPAPQEPRRKEPEEPAAAAAPTAPRKKAAKKKRKKKKTSRGFAGKLAITVAMSLAMSVAVVALTAGGIWVLEYFKRIPSNVDRTGLIAGIYVVAFTASFLYQLVRQFDLSSLWGFRRSRSAPAPSATDMIRKMQEANREPAQGAASPSDLAVADIPIEELRAQIAQSDAEDQVDRLQEDDFTTEVQISEDLSQDTTPEPVAVAAPAPQPTPVQEPLKPEPPAVAKPPEKPVEKPVEKPPERPAAEAEAQKSFLAFTSTAVGIANQGSPLNTVSRFGLNLYLAGACATLGQTKRLGRMPQLTVLRDGLQAAGNSRERAETFCAELPGYGKNPRYASMVKAGGQAMTRQLSGQSSAASDLTGLLGEWGRPEKRSAVPTEFTFLFTDLVGSTAMTSQLGNAGAQKVVRAHNTAVRAAIQAHGGREVKHTGDGIMATFPTPLAAVQATIRMQKELVSVATANPALNFSVRMGLNVGEAVQEENDFFGGAVQMTARICAAATERNIWVSKAIVDACRGQRIGFIPRGAFAMKGIQQARPLYEVAYTEAHKNELANL